jgi:four helix bundle protein
MSKGSGAMSGEPPNFDLEERTARFGEAVIEFVLRVPRNAITSPLISHLVRASTSIGANYCEANESGTRKEFKYRIGVSRRESKETKFQLRMLVAAVKDKAVEARPIWKEADELNRIFAAIHRNTRDE